MFRILPLLYPQDFVDFIMRNYFRFLDDIIHQWLKAFDIQSLYELINSLDPDLKFTMDEISTTANFLDITITAKEEKLIFDIYHKPTNAFNYLKYTSCHPRHTKNNIALSLGRRIVKICSENRESSLDKLKNHLIMCQHPEFIVEDSFAKIFQPSEKSLNEEYITFIRTFNPTQNPNYHKIQNCLYNLGHPQMIKAFGDKKTLCTTRQPKNLKQFLVKAKFQINPQIPREPRRVGLYPCGRCKYCKLGYIRYASQFTLYHRRVPIVWHYTRFFSCDSVKVLYVIFCRVCTSNYIGKAMTCKSRIAKHASDVRNPHNSQCKKCTNHLRDCSNIEEPYFRFYPFFYVNEDGLRHFLETRFRLRWKPVLNTY